MNYSNNEKEWTVDYFYFSKILNLSESHELWENKSLLFPGNQLA